ncbi:MAG: ATP-binding protein [bacterium]|nr:ATP-binding protein [bacterium]
MNIIGLDFLLFIVSIAVNVVLAIGVFFNATGQRSRTLFLFFVTTQTLWASCNYLTFIFKDPLFFLWASRFTLFFAVFHTFSFFLFIYYFFPDAYTRLGKKHVIFLSIFTVIVAALTLSPLIFVNVVLSASGRLAPQVGSAIAVFGIFDGAYLLGGLFILLRRYFRSTGEQKQQIKYVLIGFLLTVFLILILILFNFVIFGNFTFVKFGHIYTIPFVAFAAYAIVKHHLFNIKVIATEALTLIIWIILLSKIFVSPSLEEKVVDALIFAVTVVFGILLIRSVRKEVEQRERLEFVTKELQIVNSKLKEIDQQKTDFLSIAAHQLRTPMSIMNGYIELIKDYAYGKVTNETKEILGNMDESNQRLIKLVDEFLDITRIEQGRTKFDFEPKDLREVVDSVVKELVNRAKQKGLSLEWNKPAKELVASVDEEKIRHVIFNFIDNAIKYSNSGAIKIAAAGDDSGVTVRIFDHGFGFNAVDEHNFFQKFFRGENVKHTDVSGTGLGLYVCKKFIESHNGKIWAHSPGLGKGSEFGFWLPSKPIIEESLPAVARRA